MRNHYTIVRTLTILHGLLPAHEKQPLGFLCAIFKEIISRITFNNKINNIYILKKIIILRHKKEKRKMN